MVRHTQTIRPQIIDELLEFLWSFYGIGTSCVKRGGAKNFGAGIRSYPEKKDVLHTGAFYGKM